MRITPLTETPYKRGASDDPRLGDIVATPTLKEFEKSEFDAAILGVADDRGIVLNGGRAGAASAPAAIRRWLYRLVAPSTSWRIADMGNLELSAELEKDHKSAVEAMTVCLARAKRVILLGGGHDWGFAPIAALIQAGRAGFVNVDSHLDVRPSATSHSGTSFWRALEGGIRGADALWLGAQRSACSPMHLDYIRAKGGEVHFDDVAADWLGKALRRAHEIGKQVQALDVSFDMDVVNASEAPGVSAPQAGGISARNAVRIVRTLSAVPAVRTFGIYEVSPPNDVADVTSRLAARLVWEFLMEWLGAGESQGRGLEVGN